MQRLGIPLAVLACSLGVAGCTQEAPAVQNPKDGGEMVPPPAAAPAAPLPATPVNPKDGAEMVLVPAGDFLMGTSEQKLEAMLAANGVYAPEFARKLFDDEVPQRSVYLDAYYIYKTEVTVVQYRRFCQATGREMPPAPDWGWQDTHPIVSVTWDDAKAYADWAGVALPTEAQWERAARGAHARVYPWGWSNAWPPPVNAGNFADEACKRSGKHDWRESSFVDGYDDGYAETSPVGSFPAGASPYGVLDMAGNVSEWCVDFYDPSYYKTRATQNPTGPRAGDDRVFRGGSWACEGWNLRAARRLNSYPSFDCDDLGFRCARGL